MSSWKIKNSEDLYTVYCLLTNFWKEIVITEIKVAYRIYAFKTLLLSISLNNNNDLFVFNKKISKVLKKEAFMLFLLKKVGLKQRLIFFMCSLSPYYYKKIITAKNVLLLPQ